MSTLNQNSKWNALLAQAEAGDSEAQYEVGMSYHDGVWNRTGVQVEQDFKAAFEWFNRSFDNGNLEAMVLVADYLSDGIAGERNLEFAVELYNEAIEKGSSTAANNLGTVYRDEGAFEKAFHYYNLSKELSGVSYSLSVGLCYYYGIGVSEDKIKAIKIFEAVAENEENCSSGYEIDEANFLLGQIYLHGLGVTKSIKQARKFLELADSDGDHRSAQKILQIIGRNKK